jgi:hypothetical protein
MSTPQPDLAAEGRRMLEEWKQEHRKGQLPYGGLVCKTKACKSVWPCPTARLVAAVEHAVYHTELGEQANEVLAKLAEGR